MEDIKVTIWCVTYNQAKYIKKTLEGFLMQKTSFAFEIFIHDDASTDGTVQILQEYQKKYPGRFTVFYEKENVFGTDIDFEETYLLPNMHGKYIAVCDGDDYWSCEKKLQKQFEYMEKNETCVLCVHDVQKISQDGSDILGIIPPPKTFLTNAIIESDKFATMLFVSDFWPFHTSSFFYKKDLLISEFAKQISYGRIYDRKLLRLALVAGNVCYIHQTMSCYRVAAKGSYTESCKHMDIDWRYKMYLEIVNMEKYFDKLTKGEFHEKISCRIVHELLGCLFWYDNQIVMSDLKMLESDYIKGINLPLKIKIKYYMYKYFPILSDKIWRKYLAWRTK